jgi:hypothetical protein
VVTLETTGGKSGCFHALDAKGFVKMNEPYGCWGEASFVPVSISFRAKAVTAGTVKLVLKRLRIK